MTSTLTPRHEPPTRRPADDASGRGLRGLLGRLTTAELVVGGIVAAVMVVLVAIEPDILGAPVENSTTVAFTAGGTLAAAVALVAMLRFRVPAPVRIVVLLVPFVVVNWWLLSPFFVDDVVDEEFSTSIADQLDQPTSPASSAAPDEATGADPADASAEDAGSDAPVEPVEEAPAGPVLVGAGTFVGLAGHSGTGEAGLFQNPDGTYALRFENFDIENGPDLEVYLVPGADQVSLAEGSIHLGSLKGNVGDQTYDLPPDTDLAPGGYTALVWCEAFSVEFVGATLSVS